MVRTRFGENAAERGSGFGPWTVQASLSAEEGGIRDLGLERAAAREADGSNSRYEEPEAVGISPVLRTRALKVSCDQQEACRQFIQIFRSSVGWRWRWARFATPVEDSWRDA